MAPKLPPVDITPPQKPKEPEYPTLTSVGIVKLPKGWVTVLTESKGNTITHREVLTDEPGSYLGAVQKMEIEVLVRFKAGKAKARA